MLLVSWLNLGPSTPILKISEGKRRIHVKWKPGGKAAHMHANWMLTSFTKQNTQLRRHNWIHTWVAAGVAFIFGNKELPWEVLKSRTELKLVFFLKEVLTCGSILYTRSTVSSVKASISVYESLKYCLTLKGCAEALLMVADKGTAHLLMHGSHLSLSSLCPELHWTRKYEKEREPSGKTTAAQRPSLWLCALHSAVLA